MAAVVAALVLGALAPAVAGNGGGTDARVVELFMSQSCGACPPAEDLLGEIAHRDDVIALSWPIDYWDYTGWKDTFARPENSLRQRAYNDHLGLRYLYTPQMFINGASQVVGSDRDEVLATLDTPAKSLRLPLTIIRRGNIITIELPDGPAAMPATIWLVRYNHVETVKVRKGENRGKTLTLHNVVRDSVALGEWNGKAMVLEFTLAELSKGGMEACAVLVQSDGTGPIIGAANIELAAS